MPLAAQATVPGGGRMEGDTAEGSPGVMVLGERFMPTPLAPSVAEGGIPIGMSRREGSAALGAGGELSLTLMSVGSGSPARGEPLLQWIDL